MDTKAAPTDALNTAAKPWIMLLTATWAVSVLSYVALAIYVWLYIWQRHQNALASLQIIATWIGVTWCVKQIGQHICIWRLQLIRGGSFSRRHWISLITQAFIMAFFVCYCWIRS